MAGEALYPSSVLYAHMKQFGGISNKDLAGMLFAEDFNYGGASLRQRIADRTFLTRNIVHVEPGRYPERSFADFVKSAQRISGLILSKYPGSEGKRTAAAFFGGSACDDMCAALRSCGQNDALYRNITSRVDQMELSSDADKVTLLVLQFVATGCLGDAARATEITMECSRRFVNESFRTSVAYEGEGASAQAETDASAMLALCRMAGGKLVMPFHELSADEPGTEIGTLSTSAHAINDVDSTVSKRHARVFRDGGGQWFVEGLGSTNGTAIVRGDTKARVVVEPPRSEREEGKEYPPVRIYPSDIICLADTTRFMVVAVAG